MDQFALDFRQVLCCENGLWGNSLLLAGEAEMPEARGAPAAAAGEERAGEPGALSSAAQGLCCPPASCPRRRKQRAGGIGFPGGYREVWHTVTLGGTQCSVGEQTALQALSGLRIRGNNLTSHR